MSSSWPRLRGLFFFFSLKKIISSQSVLIQGTFNVYLFLVPHPYVLFWEENSVIVTLDSVYVQAGVREDVMVEFLWPTF